jgi:OmpA-OmpF porin, OOP family
LNFKTYKYNRNKMKQLLIGFCCIFFTFFHLRAQNVEWASKVIEFSSQLTNTQYSAEQVLNKPNVLPAGGESPSAWAPSKTGKAEFIKVGFTKPLKIQQIAVAETFNPSALYQVFTYDKDGKEYLINTFEPRPIEVKSRLLNIFLEKTEYEVHAVKLVFKGDALPGYYSIDAIGISDSKVPIKVSVNVAQNIRKDLKPEKLSSNINSPYKEFGPLLSPDGKTLFFSRRNHPDNTGGLKDKEDIWYSEIDSATGEWGLAKNLGLPINTIGPNFINSITPDGNSIVLLLGNQYTEDGRLKAGVSISSKTEAGWTKPQALDIVNEYNNSPKANYFLANNRKVLLHSVERDDTRGDRDIYVSFLQKDGKWSEPVNLGSIINTASEETSPFLAADDKTLYFSSRGFSGYGGNDVFITRRLDDTWKNWSEPENLGPAINSERDDYFINIPETGKYAYYSKEISDDDADVYRLALPIFHQPLPTVAVKGKVLHSETQKPIAARIVYEELPSGKEIGIAQADSITGEYQIVLPSNALYGFRAEATGFLPISQNVDLKEQKENKELTQNLLLVPIKVGATVVLNNIFFDTNKSQLKEESFPELDRVAQFLTENGKVEIEISGHTDNVGSDKYNLQLSQKRAKAVSAYFETKGINGDRIDVKSFGKSKPVASNSTPEGRSKNRRVEFKILKAS